MQWKSRVRLCRLREVVMDGRRVPADVLFFYKTLPLCTAVQGSACHACDEWPLGNIFTSDPEHIRGYSHRHTNSSMQPCSLKLVNTVCFLLPKHTEKSKGVSLRNRWRSRCSLLTFSCVFHFVVHTETAIMDFAPNGFSSLLLLYLILDLPLEMSLQGLLYVTESSLSSLWSSKVPSAMSPDKAWKTHIKSGSY